MEETVFVGNGMTLEWKRGYPDKPECWWIRDTSRFGKSKTYEYKDQIRSVRGARWSGPKKSWYVAGKKEEPPEIWLGLINVKEEKKDPEKIIENRPTFRERFERQRTPFVPVRKEAPKILTAAEIADAISLDIELEDLPI